MTDVRNPVSAPADAELSAESSWCVFEVGGTIRGVSPGVLPLWGDEPVVGQAPTRFLPLDGHAAFAALTNLVVDKRTVESLAHQVLTPDGGLLWVKTVVSALVTSGGAVTELLWTARAIATPLPAAPRSATGMASLPANVAIGAAVHDLNNLLQVISANVEMLRDEGAVTRARAAAADPQEPDGLAEIAWATTRSMVVTRSLLAHARTTPTAPESCDLNVMVERVSRHVTRLVGGAIVVETQHDPLVSAVQISESAFEQVILNLATNAQAAMPRGGALYIDTRLRVLDVPTAAEAGVTAGPYAVVTVRDTGTGIPAVVLARMFEPFFSTKGVRRGTGLGLPSALNIVRAAGGFIRVDSTVGVGTTFRIHLPHRIEGAAGAHAPVSPTAPMAEATVLLVVFDPMLRTAVQRELERVGLLVLPATYGLEAVHVARSAEADPAVVITDLALPDLDGASVLTHVRHYRPTAGLIALANDQVPSGGVPVGTVVLEKPVELASLLAAVRALLSAGTRPPM